MRNTFPCRLAVAALLLSPLVVRADTGITSLTDPAVRFHKAEGHTVTLRRGPVTAVVVDNEAFGDTHRAGYNGIASLAHDRRGENLFVPQYAGLNLEHYFDGSNVPPDRMYEPRRAPMELRIIDAHTAELYQPPTPTWKVESCTRFTLEQDGTVRMRFECIPRARTFKHGYLGCFWASYIHQPESLDIHFLGRERDGRPDEEERWVRGVTPRHGVESTHVPAGDRRAFKKDDDFPRDMLIFSRSKYAYTRPFYYGVSHGMAAVFMFRPEDQVLFSQSPSGGGDGNPAWDFQWLIPDYEVGKPYGFEMRLAYVPYESPEQIRTLYEQHHGGGGGQEGQVLQQQQQVAQVRRSARGFRARGERSTGRRGTP